MLREYINRWNELSTDRDEIWSDCVEAVFERCLIDFRFHCDQTLAKSQWTNTADSGVVAVDEGGQSIF